MNLLVKYYYEARHGIYIGSREDEFNANKHRARDDRGQRNGKSTTKNLNSRATGRCCICLDPISIQNVSIVAFFCTHTYHTTCLTDTSSSVTKNSTQKSNSKVSRGFGDPDDNTFDDEESDDGSSTDSDGLRMRCILCTTAAKSSKRKA